MFIKCLLCTGLFTLPCSNKEKVTACVPRQYYKCRELGLENTGEHKDRSRLSRSRAAHEEDSSQGNSSTRWLVLTYFLCFIWAQRAFASGQMTQGCVEWGVIRLAMQGPDAVLRPLRVLSVGSESAFRCTVGALLRVKKTDRTDLVISMCTHLSSTSLRAKKFIKVIQAFLHRSSLRGLSTLTEQVWRSGF